MLRFVNIAAYKFVSLDRLRERRDELRKLCVNEHLKGTILLSPEGINLFTAGLRRHVDRLLACLRSDPLFTDLQVKESLSAEQPFNRMLVKIKKEIIAFGVDEIDPRQQTPGKCSPKVSAEELKRWLDEGRDITLLDVRNDYEITVGTFQKAQTLGIGHFRFFPEAVKALPEETRQKPVVMFCTGGIRCEKAGPFMVQQGFGEVYQLDGGILKYFERCGGQHYQGDCFVFDKRVAIDPNLNEADCEMCYVCQAILTPQDLQSSKYVYEKSCPNCYRAPAVTHLPSLAERNEAIRCVATPLPGCVPYENRRPLSVPQRCDGNTVIEFLRALQTHFSVEQWREVIEQDQLLRNGLPVARDEIVRAGQRLIHLLPNTVEPPVNAEIEILYEDSKLVAVDKPAPLPMHPCGRFNRNTLSYLLQQVFAPSRLKTVHRLDANTGGIVVFCKSRESAAKLQSQFLSGDVAKRYLVRVSGSVSEKRFCCDAAISAEPSPIGLRKIDECGLDARTEFALLRSCADGTSLLEARPLTGRTNQIRIHLAHLGFPICGDPTYGSENARKETQTLDVQDPPLCLHSQSIEFTHPETGNRIVLQSRLPQWASELL